MERKCVKHSTGWFQQSMWCTFWAQKEDREMERFSAIPYANQSVRDEGKWRWDVCARWWRRWPKIAERKKLKLYKFQIQDKSKRKTLSEESHWNDLKKTKQHSIVGLNKWIFQGFRNWFDEGEMHLKRQTQPKCHISFPFWCFFLMLFVDVCRLRCCCCSAPVLIITIHVGIFPNDNDNDSTEDDKTKTFPCPL